MKEEDLIGGDHFPVKYSGPLVPYDKIFDRNEVDVLIYCPCGRNFYIYVSGCYWACKDCGRIYTASVSVQAAPDTV